MRSERSVKRHIALGAIFVGAITIGTGCGTTGPTVQAGQAAPSTQTTLSGAQLQHVGGATPQDREQYYESLPESMRTGARKFDDRVIKDGMVGVAGLKIQGFVKADDMGRPTPTRREDLAYVYDEAGTVVAYWAGGLYGVIPKDVVDRGDKSMAEILAMRSRVEI